MRNRLQKRIMEALAVQSKFQADLRDNPYSALVWSTKVFQANARLRVFSEVDAGLSKGLMLEEARDYAQRQLITKAGYASTSTSPTHNLMAQCETEAWALVLEMLEEECHA